MNELSKIEERVEFIAALRKTADFYENTPAMPIPHVICRELSVYNLSTAREFLDVMTEMMPCTIDNHGTQTRATKEMGGGLVLRAVIYTSSLFATDITSVDKVESAWKDMPLANLLQPISSEPVGAFD